MSVYDLYQSYLNQIQNPVMSSPVVDPTQDPLYLLYLQQQQQQQQGGGDNQMPTMSSYNPNIGPNFQDYEAQAYGVGSTFRGGIANLVDKFSQLPTPMNLAMRGIRAIGNMFGGQGPAMGPAFTGTPSQMAALMSEMSGPQGGFSDGTSSASDGGQAGATAASAAGANDGPDTGGSF